MLFRSVVFIFVGRVLFSMGLMMAKKYVRFSVVAGLFGVAVSVSGLFLASFYAYLIMDPVSLFTLFVSSVWASEVVRWLSFVVPLLVLVALLFEILMLFDASKKFEK